MKKNLLCLFLICAVIANIYLIFYWNPKNKVVNQEEVSKEVVSYSKSLYKFDKENSLQQLSTDNKKELEKIMKKLSTFDYGKIKEYYEYPNEEEGLINIFKLLRKRLTTEDYKRIQEISSVFLDIDGINKKIKNN
jgi:hypothetical protein